MSLHCKLRQSNTVNMNMTYCAAAIFFDTVNWITTKKSNLTISSVLAVNTQTICTKAFDCFSSQSSETRGGNGKQTQNKLKKIAIKVSLRWPRNADQ